MASFLVPCSWSILVVIGIAIYLSNPIKAKFENGYLWKNIGFAIKPTDYNQYNDSQKINFWKTAAKWRRTRTVRAFIYAPLIWVGGFIVLFILSTIHITPARAKAASTPTNSPTPTVHYTYTPSNTPTPSLTPTPTMTGTPTQIPVSPTPRVIYIVNTQVVVHTTIIPVVITSVVTTTPGPTQTPWIVTVIVTQTSTPTPTQTNTPTETPTETPTP